MTLRAAVTALLTCFVLLAAAGCGSSSSSTQPTSTSIKKIPGEPTIRVRLEAAASEITLTGPTRIQLRPADRDGDAHLLATPVTIRRSGNAWAGPWSDDPPRRFDTLSIEPVGPAPLRFNDAAYPGTLQLVPVNAEGDRISAAARASLGSPDAFDVVSHVGIETYIPGVLERELYANFQPATYLSQAVAVRSYAIARIIERGPGSHFDVEATTASQVYGGQSTRAIARRAAADTAGLVLTWRDRIITAYYSSTCGGVRQSPTDVFGGSNTIPPLEPKATHSWCRISPRYEWGPVHRDRRELSRRIAAWGKDKKIAIGRVGTITALSVAATNSLGRPVRFRITDENGRVFELRADSLRHAANYHDESLNLPPIEGDDLLRSGHFDVAVQGNEVRFTNGRGFGHGVGYCQFGAEGMARAGHNPVEILAEAYPGARVQKAY